jgi:hypothetical protein
LQSNGDQGIGSAFHVGEGVFVTARHVVEGMTIRELGITESTYVRLEGAEAAPFLDSLSRATTYTPEKHLWIVKGTGSRAAL